MAKDQTIFLDAVTLIGGISHQPPNARFAHQVEDAVNAMFFVGNGVSKRPGTWFVRDLTADLPGDSYRLHGIDRDRNEKYAAIYGAYLGSMDVIVHELGGLNMRATVNISADAQAYLDAGGAVDADLRLLTIADYTIIANSKVALGTVPSDSYNVERAWRDYNILISLTTGDGYYFRTEEDTVGQPAGYWQYDVGGVTFSHMNMRTVSGGYLNTGASGFWKTAGNNPMGFRVAFCRFNLGASAGFSYSAGTLTKTGAFTNYIWRSGDHIVIGTAVGALAIGVYPVNAKTDNDNIALGAAIATGSITYTTDLFIGNEYDVIFDLSNTTLNDMADVGIAIQNQLRSAGASEAGVIFYGRGTYGAFQITSPYRGSNSKVYITAAPRGTVTTDLSATNQPFEGLLAVTQLLQGTGSIANDIDTLPPASRWKRVAPPAQTGAKLDPSKMPVKMVRTKTSLSGTNTGGSIGAATTFECVGHGLVDGETIVMNGVVSSPTCNGSRVVTVVDADHYSVPVTTSLLTSYGAWKRAAIFDIDVIDWNPRTSGDSATNPAPSLWTNGKTINDMAFKRNRLFFFGGENAVASQSGDIFNFFNANATNLVDSDPIDLSLSSDQIAVTDFAVDFRDGITVLTRAGEQFELSTPADLTASNAAATKTMQYQTRSVRPRNMGSELYFAGANGDASQLYEVRYDDSVAQSRAWEITAHVEKLLPADIQALATSANNGTILVLPPDADTIFVYTCFWSGLQKQQSAWSKYEYDNSYMIDDVAMIGDRCYLLSKTANIRFLERQPIAHQSDDTHYDDIANPAPAIAVPYEVHLDRKFYATNTVFDGVRTKWDIGVQTPGSTINRAVRVSDGEEFTLDYWSGTTVGVTGNKGGGAFILGCAYTMTVTLTRPFVPDASGKPMLGIDPMIERLHTAHKDTGYYKIISTPKQANSGPDIKTFDSEDAVTETFGLFASSSGGPATTNTFTLVNDSARPSNICTIQWELEREQGDR